MGNSMFALSMPLYGAQVLCSFYAPIEGLFFGVPGGKALTCKNFIKRAIC